MDSHSLHPGVFRRILFGFLTLALLVSVMSAEAHGVEFLLEPVSAVQEFEAGDEESTGSPAPLAGDAGWARSSGLLSFPHSIDGARSGGGVDLLRRYCRLLI